MICQDWGMNHAPDDKAACIEGHGEDDPGELGASSGCSCDRHRQPAAPDAPPVP